MKKVWHRFVLDFVMLVGLATLYSKHVISLQYHEVGGLVLGALFLLHLVFNWKWIKSVFVKLFSRGILVRTRILCVVDVLLLVSWAMVIISGACISKVVFSFHLFGQWKMWHFFFAGLSLVLSGVHLGFHIKYFDVHLKKLIPLPALVKKIVVIVLAVAVVIVGAVNYRSAGVGGWLRMPFGSSMGGGPMGGGASGEMGEASGEASGETQDAASGEAAAESSSAEPAAESASEEPAAVETADQSASEEPAQTASGEADTAAVGEADTAASGEAADGASGEASGEAGGSGEMGGGPMGGSAGSRLGSVLALVWKFGTVVLGVMTLTGVVDALCLWAKKYIRSKKKETK